MIIQFVVQQEQIDYANKLVSYSIEHHTISNIWDLNECKKDKTYDYRFTGTLGEVIFADAYGLPRPNRSFGAKDGQDLGKDFELIVNGEKKNCDTKSMKRRVTSFYKNYVLNIPSSQLNKKESLTDIYFNISLFVENRRIIATFIGYVNKFDIINNNIGILYLAGTKRIRADGTFFIFTEDTYEIDFKDFTAPPTPKITLPNCVLKDLL